MEACDREGDGWRCCVCEHHNPMREIVCVNCDLGRMLCEEDDSQ